MKPDRIVSGLLCACMLMATGCSTSSGPGGALSPPHMVHVRGVVTFPSGQLVGGALVSALGVDTTFADALGAYSLEVPAHSNTVVRAGTYSEPGTVHVGDWFGTSSVKVGRGDAHLDIELDQYVAL